MIFIYEKEKNLIQNRIQSIIIIIFRKGKEKYSCSVVVVVSYDFNGVSFHLYSLFLLHVTSHQHHHYCSSLFKYHLGSF